MSVEPDRPGLPNCQQFFLTKQLPSSWQKSCTSPSESDLGFRACRAKLFTAVGSDFKMCMRSFSHPTKRWWWDDRRQALAVACVPTQMSTTRSLALQNFQTTFHRPIDRLQFRSQHHLLTRTPVHFQNVYTSGGTCEIFIIALVQHGNN